MPSADYLDRLDTLERDDPVRLLAYAFHMNMAVFAGGYIIKRMVCKAMGLPRDGDGEGVKAFTFDPPDLDTKKFRVEFKRVLNEEVLLSEDEIGRVLEESGRVFAANNALVATVKGTDAYSQASADCTRFVIKGVVALSVFAASVSYLWT